MSIFTAVLDCIKHLFHLFLSVILFLGMWVLVHPSKEAVGVVSAVGPGVTSINIGDVVGYVDNPMGSYAEEQIIPASVAIPIPPSVDFNTAASVLLKGMTAYVLVQQAFKVRTGHIVLVHAAAGGVGALLCQWANALGATVIGTVSTQENATQATQDGCHHVIIYTKEDFVTRVAEITSGKGVHAVYDAVGKDTFKGSLACLMPRGCNGLLRPVFRQARPGSTE